MPAEGISAASVRKWPTVASGACESDRCCPPEEMDDSDPLRRQMAVPFEEMAASACQGDGPALLRK